jgi:hypothetical protein
MHRWTARFLLLVMLVPAVGPLALARVGAPQAMHCIRQPLRTPLSAQPGMQCHHGMALTPQPASPQESFNSLDCCSGNHDCCRGLKTSEWASPASNQLLIISLLIEPALRAQAAAGVSPDLLGRDSARAPPRS